MIYKNLYTRRNGMLSAVIFSLIIFSCAAGMKGKTGLEGDLESLIFSRFNTVKVAHLPTPLEEMKTLTAELGGPQLYMKRDDQTGLAFGGNKARKLEFIFADILRKKSDVVITWAGVQSNWCRQTAAAAKMYGIKPVLVLFKTEGKPIHYDGNLLIDKILDADVHFVEPGEDGMKKIEQIAEEEKSKGHNPYIVPVGGSRTRYSMTEPLGAVAYAHCFYELYTQAKKMGYPVTHVVHATGSGGTQAGLVVGAKAMGGTVKVVGISVSGKAESIKENVAAISEETAGVLGLDLTFTPEEIIVFDDYVGEGYGIMNKPTVDAITLTARKEGIILDPVYTGKAMSGLVDLIKNGYFKKDDHVVFIHTGGTPALFVYRNELMEYMK